MSSKDHSNSLRDPIVADPVRIQVEAREYQGATTDPMQMSTGSSCELNSRVNISQTERMCSLLAGTVLAGAGLAKCSFTGLLVAGAGGALAYRGYSGHCQVYDAAGIDTSEASNLDQLEDSGVHITESLLIDKTSEELYDFWRDFQRLPQFMSHLKSVTKLDEKYSDWIAKAPSIAGGEVHWTAEIIEDHKNNTITWQTMPGGGVDPSFVVTHRVPLCEAPDAYNIFREKEDGCIKVVLDPAA